MNSLPDRKMHYLSKSKGNPDERNTVFKDRNLSANRWKHCGKREKHLLKALSPFQALFSYSRLFRAKGLLYDKKI